MIGNFIGTPIGGVIRAAAATQDLTPALYSDADTFYSPSVLNTNTASPSLYSDADTFFVPTASAGSVTASPSLYSDSDTFFAPSVANENTLSPSAITDTDSFYVPSVDLAAYGLSPSLYSDTDAFYAPTVAPGTVTASASLYSDADTFYVPIVSAGVSTVSPSLYSDADTTYETTVTYVNTLTPALYADADTFFAPTLSTGVATVSPSLFANTNTFYSPQAFLSYDIAPDADLADGGWTNELGSTTDLYASIDEVVEDDADYIKSDTGPTNDICEIGLGDPPASLSLPVIISYRYKKVDLISGTMELKVRLMEGATTVKEWTHSNIGESYIVAEQPLDGTELSSIIDQNDLSLEFEATAT